MLVGDPENVTASRGGFRAPYHVVGLMDPHDPFRRSHRGYHGCIGTYTVLVTARGCF